MSDEASRQKVKRFKRTMIIAAVIIGLISITTVAWFFVNKTVGEGGLEMSEDGYANLIIGGTAAEVKTLAFTADSDPFTSAFNLTSPVNLIPCTRLEGQLYSVRNISAVDGETGIASVGKTLQLVPVAAAATPTDYYRDFEAYVSSVNLPFTDVKMRVSLTDSVFKDPDGNAITGEDAYSGNAATVDVYLDSVAAENYKGTLNVAGRNFENYDEAKTSLTFNIPSNRIPCQTEENGYVRFILRFYYDGALKENEASGRTFVNDVSAGKSITTETNVNFTVVDL